MNFVRFTYILAVVTFLVGTAIFLAYYFSGDSGWPMIGLFYFTGMLALNSIWWVALVIYAIMKEDIRKKALIAAGVLLLNLPVGMLYMQLGESLMSTLRITLINETGQEIKNIHLTGCGSDLKFSSFPPDHTEFLYVPIPGDCGIDLKYTVKDSLVQEVVVGYTTTMMGERVVHFIGKPNPF